MPCPVLGVKSLNVASGTPGLGQDLTGTTWGPLGGQGGTDMASSGAACFCPKHLDGGVCPGEEKEGPSSPSFPPRTRSGKAILSATVHCHCARGLVARPWDAKLWAKRGWGHPGEAAVRTMAGLEEASLPPFFLVRRSVSQWAWVRGGGMWSRPPPATVCTMVAPRPSQHPQEGPGRDWEQQTQAVGLVWSVPSALGRTRESRPTGRAPTR